MQYQILSGPLATLALEAGSAILDIYHSEDFGVETKEDDSPLTRADLAAHRIIVAGLQEMTPEIPVLSEESAEVSWEERRQWQQYWLVDPLDGTKEFIKRNGEFTVNIVLIDDGVPVLGVVYAPVLDWLYLGIKGMGAFKQTTEGRQQIRTGIVTAGQDSLKVVASRTHRGEVLDAWLDQLRRHFPQLDIVSMGSSLKICLVAEGSADIYPRLSPTREWDTAAAQAVLEAAGGMLADTGWHAYRYNRKEDLLNPDFFAFGDRKFDWISLLGSRIVTV